jgi:hypothetical protein
LLLFEIIKAPFIMKRMKIAFAVVALLTAGTTVAVHANGVKQTAKANELCSSQPYNPDDPTGQPADVDATLECTGSSPQCCFTLGTSGQIDRKP